MRKYVALIVMLVVAGICAGPVFSQASGTSLMLHASWDNGSPVAGAVTVGQMNSGGTNTVIATKSLALGGASLETSLTANALYMVTLTDSKGVQLVQFPFTTALINISNLQQAKIVLVFNSKTNALKTANVSVNLNF